MLDPLFLLFFLSFFSASTVYIILQSSRKGEIELAQFSLISKLIPTENWWVFFKILPVIILLLGIIIFIKSSPIYFGIIIALLFCLLGDIGIENNFIKGMVFFTLAHISFIATFIISFSFHFLTIDPFAFLMILIISVLVLVFNIIFNRFLKRGGGLEKKYRSPIRIYSLVISIMFLLTISIFYLMSLNQLGILLPLGGLLFIISDSLIAIREFHPIKVKHSVILIMSSYYTALLFLSTAPVLL